MLIDIKMFIKYVLFIKGSDKAQMNITRRQNTFEYVANAF